MSEMSHGAKFMSWNRNDQLEVKEDPDKIKVIMDMQSSLQWKSRQSFLYQEGMEVVTTHHHTLLAQGSHWKLFVQDYTYLYTPHSS